MNRTSKKNPQTTNVCEGTGDPPIKMNLMYPGYEKGLTRGCPKCIRTFKKSELIEGACPRHEIRSHTPLLYRRAMSQPPQSGGDLKPFTKAKGPELYEDRAKDLRTFGRDPAQYLFPDGTLRYTPLVVTGNPTNNGGKQRVSDYTTTKRVEVENKTQIPVTCTEGKLGGRRYLLYGHNVTSVLRFLGLDGWTLEESSKLMTILGLSVKEATLKAQLRAGRLGERGDPAKLTDEQVAQLYQSIKETPKVKKKKKKKNKR